MEILVIDDNENIKEVGVFDKQIELYLIIEQDQSLIEIAKTISTQFVSSQIIFINTLLFTKNGDFKNYHTAIILLKFLRILSEKRHIVLYFSTHTAEELVRLNPSFIIALSTGVTVLSNNSLNSYSRNELIKLYANPFEGDLTPYLRVDFEIPDDNRHNWANWWGVKTLHDIFDIYEILNSTKYEQKLPSGLKKQMESLNAQKALNFFGMSSLSIFKIIVGEAIINSMIHKSSKEYEPTDHDTNLVQREFPNCTPNLEIIILESINKDRSNIYEILKPEFLIELDRIRKIKKALKKRPKKILYIDDDARNGWSDIFQWMIYGETVSEDAFLTISEFNESEDIFSSVKSKVIECRFIPDLILLDIRLLFKDENCRDINLISGAEFLKKFGKEYNKIPVMIVTASNKTWVREGVMNLKVNTDNNFLKPKFNSPKSFWVKQGLDETSKIPEQRAREAMYSYSDFLEKINYCLDL